jgi:hypothetical protein
MPSQQAAARFGFAALVLAALIAAAAVLSVRLALLSYDDGYTLMAAAAAVGLVTLLLGGLWTARALQRNDGAHRRLGLTAFLGAALLLYPPVSTTLKRLTIPALYDVTTDTADPPRFVELLKQRGQDSNAPEFDGARQIAYDGEMHTVTYVLHDYYANQLRPAAGFVPGSKDPGAVYFWRDFEAVKQTGWTIVAFNEQTRRIEASTASFWFGRISDIVIEARAAGMGARTVIRSQSRHDTIDDGANGENIKMFLARRSKR